MKFSTLRRSDQTLYDLTNKLYTVNGDALSSTVNTGISLNALRIINASGGDVVFAINGGAPFKVVSATTFEYGLGAQRTGKTLTKLEASVTTLSGIDVYGE